MSARVFGVMETMCKYINGHNRKLIFFSFLHLPRQRDLQQDLCGPTDYVSSHETLFARYKPSSPRGRRLYIYIPI